MFIKCIVVFGLFCVSQCFEKEPESTLLPYLLRRLEKCVAHGGVRGIVDCTGFGTLKLLSKVSNQDVLALTPDIQFIKETNHTNRIGKSLNLSDLSTTSLNPTERATRFLNLILVAAGDILSGRTLKIRIPELTSERMSRAFEEGRAKIKKVMSPFMLGIGTNMLAVVPAILGMLALLVTKALVVSKVALVAAIYLYIRYSMTPSIFYGNNGYTPYGTGIYGYPGGGGGYGGYPYARSLDVAKEDTEEGYSKDFNITEAYAYST